MQERGVTCSGPNKTGFCYLFCYLYSKTGLQTDSEAQRTASQSQAAQVMSGDAVHPCPAAHPQKAEGRTAWVPVFGVWCSPLAVESAGPGQCPRGQNTCGPQAQGRAAVPCVPAADWGTLGDRGDTTDGEQLLSPSYPVSSQPISSGQTPHPTLRSGGFSEANATAPASRAGQDSHSCQFTWPVGFTQEEGQP